MAALPAMYNIYIMQQQTTSQNELFDVIVVGATPEGIALCEFLAKASPDLKVALISKSFCYVTPKTNLEGIEQVQNEVIFSSYYKGLIGFTLKDRRSLFCEYAVIATGSKPVKLPADVPWLKSSGIVYKPADIASVSKNHQVVVNGNGKDAVEYAITLAKDFKYVYLCNKNHHLDCDVRLKKKFVALQNVVYLPGCSIVSCKKNRKGRLQEVTLDTYSVIHCAALIGAYGRTPDVSGITKKMLEVDEQGYAIVKEKNESVVTPNVFALGRCARHNTKRMVTIIGNELIRRSH